MPPAESTDHDEIHGPPKPTTRIPDGQPNPFYARHRTTLAQLREEFSLGAHGQRALLLEAAEWQGMPYMLRLLVLVGSGMADPDDVLRRGWIECTEEERIAVRATLRDWLRILQSLSALTL